MTRMPISDFQAVGPIDGWVIEEKGKGSMEQHAKDSAAALWWILPLCVSLVVGTFLLDLFAPLGVAGGVPYVAPVLLSAFLPTKKQSSQ